MQFFRQFGFRYSCIEYNLIFLISYNLEQTDTPTDNLLKFKNKYPILFEALETKFGLMPSSTTRIVEQKYGQLRRSLREQLGQDLSNAQQQYIINNDYIHKGNMSQYERKRKVDKNPRWKLMMLMMRIRIRIKGRYHRLTKEHSMMKQKCQITNLVKMY